MYLLSGMRIKMSIWGPCCRANEENGGTVWMLGERMDPLSIKIDDKWEMPKMNERLVKQLAIDFCTDEASVLSKENIFTEYKRLEGRRIFREEECFLKAASVNGKILASGKKDIIDWMREKYKDGNGAWFMDMECLHELEAGLSKFGCHIGQAHPFYIATEKTEVDTKGYEIKKYIGEELEQFRGDDRFGEAFLFDDVPKDEIGIGAYKEGKILIIAEKSVLSIINKYTDAIFIS